MEETIKKFIEQETGHMLAGYDTDIIAGGIIDSFSMMKLITFLEMEFHVQIDMEKISPENFNSVTAISAYIRMLLRAPHGN